VQIVDSVLIDASLNSIVRNSLLIFIKLRMQLGNVIGYTFGDPIFGSFQILLKTF